VDAAESATPVAARGQPPGRRLGRRLAQRLPAVFAIALVLLGGIAMAVRLDAPADGTLISSWQADGVIVEVLTPGSGLISGDLVTRIEGHALTDGPGALAAPEIGDELSYSVLRDGAAAETVRIERQDPAPLLLRGSGTLVFVFGLAALAAALYLRRPDEPATVPLLITGAGFLGSTLPFVAGLPALAMATGGPMLWLYNLSIIGAYAFGWGGLLAFSLQLGQPPGRRLRPAVLRMAYLGAPAVLLGWMAVASLIAENALGWFDLVYRATTVIVIVTLCAGVVLGLVAYLRSTDRLTRSRLLWVAGGAIASAVLGLVVEWLPELLTGRQLLPPEAAGLTGLPFLLGIAVALRRHRLFDIERLANRSLVYGTVVAVLVAGYAALVAALVTGLRLSGTVAAAVAAVGAALALAPLRTAAQRLINRLMYGERDDPAGVLARLGTRMQAVPLPDDVLPAVVETVATSLRLPYVAIDLAEGTGFRLAAEHGAPIGRQHTEALTHHGLAVGRLRVSERGRDDPLEPADLRLVRSLAGEIGPAVQAVRLHQDLLRSRAEVVALREDERRRLRRDLHDGLGPALAAIGLKAGLAARAVSPDSPAGGLLGEIDTEVKAGLGDIRRLVEALRPPALDELGLVGAVRARAASLSGTLIIDVTGPEATGPLPAAVETAAYRIAVEAMTNAVRHSGARSCQVTIGIDPEAVEVTVRDDGHGLDGHRTPGVGLRSMQERAAEVGGTLSVQGQASDSNGSGTVVSARLPLRLGSP
jgi:signal transduction histidine kinase